MMNDKLFKWIDKKKNQDKALINLLKFLYLISCEWLNSVLDIILSLLLSYFFPKNKVFVIILALIVLVNIWYYFVNSYRNRQNKIDKNVKMVLDENNLMIKALDEFISAEYNNNDIGKGLFEHASDLVTSSMYSTLKTITGCEVRVSVIQQSEGEQSKKECIMVSRRSKSTMKRKKEKKTVKYRLNKDYYYLKILVDNKDEVIILDNESIQKLFIGNNKKNKIHQYIGIPDKSQTNDIAFLLQLDGMEENTFGKTEEEINEFYINYIYPYVCFLRHAYIVESKLRKRESDY